MVERHGQATRTYLEMTHPSQLQPFHVQDAELSLVHLRDCPPALYRRLYADVGRAHHWTDRLHWSDLTIAAHLAQPELSLWVLYEGDTPAGYFELRREAGGSTEVAYFGLLPEYTGRGLGKHLLSAAVERAWADGASRVWLHTSSLDHAAALPNYLKRGFRIFRTERYEVTGGSRALSDQP